jgi:hypothetical protein
MNKKNNFASFAIMVIGLISLFAVNLGAQNKVSSTSQGAATACAGKKFVMPASIETATDVFGDYLRVASAPADKRGSLFSKLTNEQKAAFVKVNWALQLVKRPGMTADQQNFVLDMISKVSPDIYDRSDPEKTRANEQDAYGIMTRAMGLFERSDWGDFIEPIPMPKDREVALVQKYQDLLKIGARKRMDLTKEMPVNDKVNVWKTQLAYHLATGRFSKAQNEFILGEMMSLTPETFAPRAHFTKEEESAFAAKALSRIYNVFTKEEGYAIFMTVGIQKNVKDEPVNTDNLQESKKCRCLTYCSSQYEMCGAENGCVSTTSGCGPFEWLGCHYQCVPV